MKFLCETASQGNPVVVYVILAVMVVAMLILPYFTNKKRNQQYMDMISSIKVGDLVKTAGGIIGKINKITSDLYEDIGEHFGYYIYRKVYGK